MKKYLILSLILAVFLVTPVSAQTSNAELLISLRAQIAQLTALIDRLLGEQQPRSNFCYEFRNDLRPGDGQPDWTKMAQVLQMEGVSSVQELQEKYRADMLAPAGLHLGTGYVGPLTRGKLNALYRCPPITGNRPPVISGVTGPTALTVGQTGTWTINASDPENGPLSYSVLWGDEPLTFTPTSEAVAGTPAYNQIATLTHTYSRAGNFYPKFSVRDNAGNTQYTSLSVMVTNSNVPRVTVTSPNGGESWVANSVQPIKWSTVNTNSNDKVDIYLDRLYVRPACLDQNPACSYVLPTPIVLDKNISIGATYNWIVATDIVDNQIPAGQYFMKICLAGTNTCDLSDQFFTITNTTSTCYVGGCSGQACSDQQGVVSTCEWRPQYACYRTARCERQVSGQCGWTPTTELSQCLINPPANY